jgi:hypothetical protein
MNYSTCVKLSRMLFGPKVWVRSFNGGIRIYTQEGDTRTVHGEGASYLEAFKDAYLVPDPSEKSRSFTESKTESNPSADPKPNVEGP